MKLDRLLNEIRKDRNEGKIIRKKKEKKIEVKPVFFPIDKKVMKDLFTEYKCKKEKKYTPSPRIIVKKDMSENLDNKSLTEYLSRIPDWLETLTEINGNPTKLYDYQIAHCLNESRFRSIEKSRQIGMSLIIAGEQLGKSHLRDVNTGIFVSYNQEEANEKIVYIQALYDSLPTEFKKKRITDNKHSQIFMNSRGQKTRIFSTAQRPPRGKGHNTDVYLDEAAFYQWLEKIYTASLPVTMRGTGVFTMLSTPYGARGRFFEVIKYVNKFPQFSRQRIPWWHCPDLCKDIVTAYKEAQSMQTEERINKFGNLSIKSIYLSMPLDDFQQEYELSYVDENTSYFPIQLIEKNVYPLNIDDFDYEEISDKKGTSVIIEKAEQFPIQLRHPKIKMFCCKSLEELADLVNRGIVRPELLGGYDVGRKKDKSEFFILEEFPYGDTSIQVVRFFLQLDRVMFEEQKSILRRSMNMLPIKKLGIDTNGLGMNLGEDLNTEFGDRVDQVPLEGTWKDKAVQQMKIRFESQLLCIPDEDGLVKQIGSIKKKISDAGFVRYDAEKDKEHHGDKFWALTLASMMGTEAKQQMITVVQNMSTAKRIISQENLKTKNVRKNNEIEKIKSKTLSFSNLDSGINDIMKKNYLSEFFTDGLIDL